MAQIHLNCVSVEFPIYSLNTRSLKKDFLRVASGGMVVRDAKQTVVVCALDKITFLLEHGDRVGLIGHNGAGKSTLLRLLAGIYEPTGGSMLIEGKISPMLDLLQGIEMELSGYDNIVTRGLLLGLSRNEINQQTASIAEMTGLGDYLSMPIRTYSSGMMVRLAFAITSHILPDVLLIDEIFGAGDAEFMKRSKTRMESLLNSASIVVMANHSDQIIKQFCNKVILLDGGKIKFIGSVEEGLALLHSSNDVKTPKLLETT